MQKRSFNRIRRNIKCLILNTNKNRFSNFWIKNEPLGLWDLWVNSMPTLTFISPEEAAEAVGAKKTGYAVWDNQDKKFKDDFNISNWEELPDD